MEERATRLLNLPDDVLFGHGGCHVFALALHDAFHLPLLWVREEDGPHDHVACSSGGGLLDFFGWFSHAEYIHEEILDGHPIRFVPVEEEVLKRRFIFTRGPGYYAHPEFYSSAAERARTWIAKHREYFDGTKQVAIPGLCRVKRANQLTSI